MKIPSIQKMGVSAEDMERMLMVLEVLEAREVPLLDSVFQFPLDESEGRLALLRKVLDNLTPGITLIINHAAMDTPELRAITTDWRGRVADYRCFTSDQARDIIKQSGVHIIGYRPLRNILRGERTEI